MLTGSWRWHVYNQAKTKTAMFICYFAESSNYWREIPEVEMVTESGWLRMLHWLDVGRGILCRTICVISRNHVIRLKTSRQHTVKGVHYLHRTDA